MTEKECINRLRTGNYRGEYGFDMQILVDTAGYAAEMMRDGRLLLKEQEAETIECKMCGHRLQKDWNWCPWCRWEIRQGYNVDELS